MKRVILKTRMLSNCSFVQALKCSLCILILLVLSGIYYIWRIHLGYVEKQMESPFDYVASTLLKPIYNLRCPKASKTETTNCILPKLFMISGRPFEERVHAYNSWLAHGVEIIDTKELSLWLLTHTDCKRKTFGNRLFRIYQKVFTDIFKKYPTDKDFIFIEDDVLLIDFESLKAEACMARRRNLRFYSFFQPSAQQSCLYHHGTLAFYINRSFLKHLATDVSKPELCRLPIDIYIAKHGPWYSTTKTIVKHNATRRLNLE